MRALLFVITSVLAAGAAARPAAGARGLRSDDAAWESSDTRALFLRDTSSSTADFFSTDLLLYETAAHLPPGPAANPASPPPAAPTTASPPAPPPWCALFAWVEFRDAAKPGSFGASLVRSAFDKMQVAARSAAACDQSQI